MPDRNCTLTRQRSPAASGSPVQTLANSKLLVIAPSAYTLGGVQNWLDYLLPGLEARGAEVTLGLVSGRAHQPGPYLNLHPWSHVVEIRNHSGSNTGRIEAISRAVEDVEPDLVLSANVGDALEAVHWLRWHRRTAARLVMSVHGIEGDYFREMHHYAEVLDGVVATNRLSAALAIQQGAVSEGQVFYAPYGVEQPGVPKDQRTADTVLWMGRLEQEQKRVLELPDIVRRLAESGQLWRLQVAGEGPEAVALRATMPETDLVSVEFLGTVAHGTLVGEILPGAGALLVNSTWETGPITIWEAMAAGVPVVSSRYTGSGLEGALLDGENALLFDVGDTDAAARCLKRLREDRGLVERLTNAGRELVAARYSREISVDAWAGALDSILQSEPRGVPSRPEPLPSQGRLDRLLGASLAERVRRATGIGFQHRTAGGEWPHARHGMSPEQREKFFAEAVKMDLEPGGES